MQQTIPSLDYTCLSLSFCHLGRLPWPDSFYLKHFGKHPLSSTFYHRSLLSAFSPSASCHCPGPSQPWVCACLSFSFLEGGEILKSQGYYFQKRPWRLYNITRSNIKITIHSQKNSFRTRSVRLSPQEEWSCQSCSQLHSWQLTLHPVLCKPSVNRLHDITDEGHSGWKYRLWTQINWEKPWLYLRLSLWPWQATYPLCNSASRSVNTDYTCLQRSLWESTSHCTNKV